MALINPHPALKAAVPQSPMVDGWMGDDWFHNGAFRVNSFDYMVDMSVGKGDNDAKIPRGSGDDYTAYLEAGSAGDFARKWGLRISRRAQADGKPGLYPVLVFRRWTNGWLHGLSLCRPCWSLDSGIRRIPMAPRRLSRAGAKGYRQ
jgi:predicted acyl esterase